MRTDHDSQAASCPTPLLLESGTLRASDSECGSCDRPAKTALLTVIRGHADLGVHQFLSGRTLIGRSPSCTLPLHDMKVSSQHAVITPLGNGDYCLDDLRSTNGTRVNGTPVTESWILKDGEKIFLGQTVIRFSLADELETSFHNEVATLVGTDPLTGLPSKRRFDEALEFSLQTALRNGSPLAMLMMDMDGVKRINDTHGHLFGAHVIGQTGRLIGHVVGDRGHACRFGGDEFSVFLPGHDNDTAAAIGEQVRLALENAKLEMQGIALHPTISIGVASFPQAASNALALLARADEALYRAKANGRNCVAT
ncbi:GGDEF domain-containing protein [Stieleria sp. TO1_6]|uniref:GGDEF domain-containing protein n=1 Tax=Stieleria tagensis TaxID=2956795 RepID=UPI00209B2670|nr:GGDEF domain-containing protein [Stieleria tagensis]MCO8120537.1 GGDEF domain-containing protein [Stieleria tagensis]